MIPRHPLISLLNGAIALALIVLLGAIIYGHLGGEDSGLSLTNSYITEYMKKAPHWPWLIVASFSFAAVLFLVAILFLIRAGNSLLVQIGCLLLAATSMGNFFVAYAPVRRVEQPPQPSYQWWTPAWWFTSSTSHNPYENGMADAYSDVHYRATRLVVATGITSIFLIALGSRRLPGCRAFAQLSMAGVILSALFFQMGDRLGIMHGLWQRLGFLLMYTWLWFARHICQKIPIMPLPSPSRAEQK